MQPPFLMAQRATCKSPLYQNQFYYIQINTYQKQNLLKLSIRKNQQIQIQQRYTSRWLQAQFKVKKKGALINKTPHIKHEIYFLLLLLLNHTTNTQGSSWRLRCICNNRHTFILATFFTTRVKNGF